MRENNHHVSRCSLQEFAIKLSVIANVCILIVKSYAYIRTKSLSVLAALIDSVIDLVSQLVLYYTERSSSSVQRSNDFYPAGASRLAPVGVLICAALMAMASFEVIKDSILELAYKNNDLTTNSQDYIISLCGMIGIIIVKFILFLICKTASIRISSAHDAAESTLEALAQDHLNDVLSNSVAVAALVAIYNNSSLWYLDPIGALIISLYIIYSWFNTGKVQINQLIGRAAPESFIEELRSNIADFDERIICIDACRVYHFGPKFLVELEIVLPRDTPLWESHDLGMDLQYEVEAREEIERCFVHIDYEQRQYDEHVISKNVELRERYHSHSNLEDV
jgi:cation diffusion facilitator family transporter